MDPSHSAMRADLKLDVLGSVLLARDGAGVEWIIHVRAGRAAAIDDQRLFGVHLIRVTRGTWRVATCDRRARLTVADRSAGVRRRHQDTPLGLPAARSRTSSLLRQRPAAK